MKNTDQSLKGQFGCLFILGLFFCSFVITCCIPAGGGGSTPAFIYKKYNDTINLMGYAVAEEITDTIFYDLNNDHQQDFAIAHTVGGDFQQVDLVLAPAIFTATKDSVPYWLKSLTAGQMINVNLFQNTSRKNYRVYFTTPVGWPEMFMGFTDYNPLDGTFYYVFMNNSFGNNTHNYAWLKMKFSGNLLIVIESGYNVTPAIFILAGQH